MFGSFPCRDAGFTLIACNRGMPCGPSAVDPVLHRSCMLAAFVHWGQHPAKHSMKANKCLQLNVCQRSCPLSCHVVPLPVALQSPVKQLDWNTVRVHDNLYVQLKTVQRPRRSSRTATSAKELPTYTHLIASHVHAPCDPQQ
jgi:hypothetical protein